MPDELQHRATGDATAVALAESDEPLDAESARALARCFAHPNRSVRRRAADRIADGIRCGAVPAAVCDDALASDDPVRRWSAAFALGRAGRTTPRVIEVALEQFSTADGDVRWAAAAIITPVARVIEDLRATLRSMATGPNATMRKMALLCLADSGDTDTSLAIDALRDDDAFVRLAAVKALGRIGAITPAVVPALQKAAAEDADGRIRRAATAIAGRLDNRQTTE